MFSLRPCLSILAVAVLAQHGLTQTQIARQTPLALIVKGEGGQLRVKDRALWLTPRLGMELFAGDRIKAGKSGLTLAYCPARVLLTVGPDTEFTVPPVLSDTASPAVIIGPQLPVCELPEMDRFPLALSIDDERTRLDIRDTETLIRSLPISDQTTKIQRRFESVNNMLGAPGLRLIALVSRAAILERQGWIHEALEQYRQIWTEFPDASWTAGVIARNVIVGLPDGTPVVNSSNLNARAVGDKDALERKAKEEAKNAKTYAFLIGISEYRAGSGIPNLSYASIDAGSIADFLHSERGGSVADDHMWVLRNEEATRDRIDHDLAEFVKGKGDGANTLVIFAAAHGRYLCTNKPADAPVDCEPGASSERPYILTWDSDTQGPNMTGYPMIEFYRLITQHAAKFGRILIYVDVCHAGAFTTLPSNTVLNPQVVQDLFKTSAGKVGIMTASSQLRPEERKLEYAYESRDYGGGHGIFTYYLLRGLNGDVAASSDGKVLFSSLYRQVEKNVLDATGQKQDPARFFNSQQLAALDDASKTKGIPLGPVLGKNGAAPRTAAATRVQLSGEPDEVAFADALRGGRVLPTDDNNAWSSLGQLRSRLDPAVFQSQDYAGRLRVALEEKGQQILIQYLKGEQDALVKADFLRGARFFKLALQIAPDAAFDESRRLFCLGRAEIFQKHYDNAVRLLERSIRIDPGRAYSYNALGIAFLEQVPADIEYYGRAISAFEDAMRLAPYWAYPRHNRALAYAERGNYVAAVDEYHAAMRLAPQFSYLPYNLGLLYQQLNDLRTAGKFYKLARKKAEAALNAGLSRASPNRWQEGAEPINGLATLALLRNQRRKSERLVRQALNEDSGSLSARHNLALLSLQSTRDDTQAESLWKQNLSDDPTHLPSLVGYSDFLNARSRSIEAIPLYREILKQKPQFTLSSIGLALALLQQGHVDTAEDILKEPLRREPNRPGLLAASAEVLYLQQRLTEARQAFSLAASFTSDRKQRSSIQFRQRQLGL